VLAVRAVEQRHERQRVTGEGGAIGVPRVFLDGAATGVPTFLGATQWVLLLLEIAERLDVIRMRDS